MHTLNDPLLSQSPEFAALRRHADDARQWHLGDLFAQDSRRAERFSLEAVGLFLDYSKTHLQSDTLSLLAAFARARGVETLRDAMFRGERVNLTENRAALHTVLRLPRDSRFEWEGEELVAEVWQVLDRMEDFAARVRSGAWKGYSGKSITDVVNIGIGGSDLGPAMTCAALRPFTTTSLSFHFLSNVDGHATSAVLGRLDPETTLFIVSSKSFSTHETLLNAHDARAWFLRKGKAEDLQRHFVAVSTNTDAVTAFGIAAENMFPFRDWVGGRYSIWSSIGLSLMVAIGGDHFRGFLSGAHAMDEHFRQAPLERNMPALLALSGFWYRQFFNAGSHLIAPYHQDLSLFPAYLQQLEMESNGKGISRDGQPVGLRTAPVIWGSVGTNGQHAYFQMLHQGTDIVPVDFIAVLKPAHDYVQQHKVLLANCFAQAEALMNGNAAPNLAPHRACPGNHPSHMLLLERLTPATLGALVALYEHKTFVQGALWNVNSFDQWGVELGKTLATRILSELDGSPVAHAHDSSTTALIARASAALE
jgi:glucose-6-phosphate isomerase